ncbi:MAG: DUF1559 domain-containing protein, partial [Planctomycetaceae bacterium]
EQDPLAKRINEQIAADQPGQLTPSFQPRSACAVSRQPPPLFLCPSDPVAGTSIGRQGCGGSNYVGNFGSGVRRDGFNGMFLFLQPKAWGTPDHIRPQHVSDGLSNTAMLSEVLLEDGSTDRLRNLWELSQQFIGSEEFDEFVAACENVDVESAQSLGGPGSPWAKGSAGSSLYCHVLPPNRPSCENGPYGAYTAASHHRNGVNVLYADGAVRFISEDVDRGVWRAFGSRDGADTVGF